MSQLHGYDVPGDICVDITRCHSDMWNRLERFHFIPKKNRSSILRSKQRLDGINVEKLKD